MSDQIYAEWLDTAISGIENEKVRGAATLLLPDALAELTKAAEAKALTADDDESLDRAAENEWRKTNPTEVGKVDAIDVQIEKIRNMLADKMAERSALTENAIAQFRPIVEQNIASIAQEVKANYRTAKADFLVFLERILPEDVIKNAPALPGSNKGSGSGKRAGGGWRPDLDSAYVDGNKVEGTGTGGWPTLSDVQKVVGSTSPTHKFAELLIEANGGIRLLKANGTDMTITVQDKPVTIKLVPRKEADKPQRGRAKAVEAAA